MEIYTKKCLQCQKVFEVNVTTMGVPGGKDREDIDCPYCGFNNGYRMTSGFVETYKLDE